MSRLWQFWESSVGKKIVMSATGIVGMAFVLAHMSGNLQVFLGPDKFNAYANFLQQDIKELVWLVRGVLLVAVVLHVTAAVQLTLRNRAARPDPYVKRDPQVSTYAARTLRWGGAYLLVFIVYHLLHFTTGDVHPAFSKHAAYGNVVIGFRVTWVALFYLGAMACLGLHLYHGAWAAFRTLGVARPSTNPIERRIALAFAIVVAGGFAAVPLAVMLGLVR